MKYGDRIVVDPEVMHGKPVIKGTRIPVYIILSLLAGGDGSEGVLKEYPDLNEEDVLACLEYAVEGRLSSLPLCRKYYGRLIQERLTLPKPEESDLVSAFWKPDDRAESLEEQLGRLSPVVRNFEKMFDLKLGKEPAPDESIMDRRFEVDTADYLHSQGFRDIEYIPPKSKKGKTPDFLCQRQGRPACVEAKAIREGDMKGFHPIDPGAPDLGFSASRCRDVRSSTCHVSPPCTYHQMQGLFRTKLTEAVDQIDAYVTDHGLMNCGKTVAIWVNRLPYRLSFRNAALENVQVVYEQEFSIRLDCVLVFLDNPMDPVVLSR